MKRLRSVAPKSGGGKNTFENVVKVKNPPLENADKWYVTYNFKDIPQLKTHYS